MFAPPPVPTQLKRFVLSTETKSGVCWIQTNRATLLLGEVVVNWFKMRINRSIFGSEALTGRLNLFMEIEIEIEISNKCNNLEPVFHMRLIESINLIPGRLKMPTQSSFVLTAEAALIARLLITVTERRLVFALF